MKIVVTGASGHLGANLVRLLLEDGHQVRALIHGATESPSLHGLPDVEFLRGDVLDPSSLDAAFAGTEIVVHLAGKISVFGDPDGSVWKTNVLGTTHVAEAALRASVRRLIHTSSVHAYDYNSKDSPALDEGYSLLTESSPGSVYDRSKGVGQAKVLEVARRGLDAVIVNPTAVIGPHDYEPSRLGRVFLDLKNRAMPMLTGGGFDFVDVRDVARGIVRAMEVGRRGESYLLGGHNLSIVELGCAAEAATGVKAPRLTCPLWLAQATAPFAELGARLTKTEPRYTRESIQTIGRGLPVDSSKARRDLNFANRPLEETVRAIYASFSERGL